VRGPRPCLRPDGVAVGRNLYVARDAADADAALARQAAIHERQIGRSRGPEGSRRSHIMAYADKAGATEAHTLFGPPGEIVAGLGALRAVGVRYVLINGGDGDDARQSMRRFAAEVMPASAGTAEEESATSARYRPWVARNSDGVKTGIFPASSRRYRSPEPSAASLPCAKAIR
jgi:Acetyltransferase (GNAT) domain